jgi:SPP1 gp7 family putative phage head morphogenesis protein
MLLILANTHGDIEKELRNFYQKYGKDGVVTYSEARKWISEHDHARRWTALVLYFSNTFITTLTELKTKFEKMLKSVIQKETGFFDVEIDTSDSDKLLTIKWGDDDSTWDKRLEYDVILWNNRIIGDLKKALLAGATLDVVLTQLDKRFESIEKTLKALAMSESTAIGSLARLRIFKELGVTKYRFYSKPDERRCETCGALHGQTFPISAYEVGTTASPIHSRCRCYEIPILG